MTTDDPFEAAMLGAQNSAADLIQPRDEFDAAMAEAAKVPEASLSRAAAAAAAVTPDRYAEAQALGERRGTSAEAVIPEFDSLGAIDQHQQVAAATPATAAWAGSDPANYALAHDELPHLGRFEQAWETYKGWATKQRDALARTLLGGTMAVGDRIANPMSTLQETTDLARSVPAYLERVKARAADALNTGTLTSAGGTMQMVGEQMNPLRNMAATAKDPYLKAVFGTLAEANPMAALEDKGKQITAAGVAAGDAAMAGIDQPKTAGAAVKNPWAYREYLGVTMLESLPAMALAMAARRPQLAGDVMGITTAGQTYGQDRAEGVDPYRAATDAGAQGVLERGFGMPTFEVAQAPGLGAMRRVIFAGATEGSTEYLTGVSQYAAGQGITGKPLDEGEMQLQGVVSALAGIGMGGPVGVIEAVVGHPKLQAIESATQGAQFLTSLQQTAQAAKLKDRNPKALANLVASLKAQGGPQVAYIDGNAFVGLYQSEADAYRAAADYTGRSDALQVALATGGDLALPIEHAVRFLGSNVGEAALSSMKLEPLHPAVGETAKIDYEAEIAGVVHEVTAAYEAQPADTAAGAIEQDILGELQATGRYTPADAQAMAQLLPRFYAGIARSTGKTVEQVRDRYPVSVISTALGDTLRRINPAAESLRITPVFEAIRSGKIPTQRQVYGPSLVDELVNAGGVVDAGGELKSFDAIKARPGLINAKGMELDRALTMAREQGFFPPALEGQPDILEINDLIDAIDRDLRGDGVFRDIAAQPELADLRAAALAWQAELPGLVGEGETLADLMALSNAEILDRASAAVRDAYEQDVLTPTDNASKVATDEQALEKLAAIGGRASRQGWAKNTRVVGKDGRPAIVRRGSRDGKISEESFKTLGASSGNPSASLGVWFSSDITDASRYGKVGDYYLDLQNPKTYDLDTLPDFDGAEDAAKLREQLKNAGHDGIVFDASAVGGPVQFIAFAPEHVIPAPDQAEFAQGGERGSIAFPRSGIGNGASLVRLAETADQTTFLHEMGHFFLEVLANESGQPDAPASIQADFSRVLGWFGVPDAATWAGMDLEARRPFHEQFARGFEQYLGEGKAPAPGLRRAFRKFKAWVVSVYQDLRALKVELTPEVRSVFDRLLATEDEITAAAESAAFTPVLPVEEARRLGMSEHAIGLYAQAVERAKETLAAKVLHAKFRETRAWYRAQVRAERARVTVEAETLPVYQAIAKLRGSGKTPALLKLDKGAIVIKYGEGLLTKLHGMYSLTDGVTPNLAADVLGYESGEALLTALINAKPKADYIRAEADARVRERHGDPMTDGTVPNLAMTALHNARQAQALDAEIALLAKLAGEAPPGPGVLREAARRIIATRTARELTPHSHLVAERKAANEATKAAAAGKYAEALAFKRQQALSAALYAEASAAQREMERARKYLQRFDKKDVQQRLGRTDYRDAINALLEAHDLRRLTGKNIDRRFNLATFVAAQKEKGEAVDLPPRWLQDLPRKPFASLTLTEARELRDSVRHLDHLSNLKNKLLLKGQLVDRIAIDTAVAESVLRGNKVRPERFGVRTAGDKARTAVLEVRALQGAASDLARQLEGFAEGGALWQNTVGVIREAVTRHTNPELEAAQKLLAENYRTHFTRAEIRALETGHGIPGVPGRWSRANILALALNWGNAGNRQAILEQASSRLSEQQVATLLGTLTSKDWAFVRAEWEQVNAYWPRIAEAQKRRTGLAPEKVPALPFSITTADGQTLDLPGGYYPLKYEADSTKRMGEEVANFYEAIRTGQAAKAATRRGHTEERVGSGGRTVVLDLGVLEGHLRNVVRDLTLGDEVNYVHQVLSGHALSQAVSDTGQLETLHALEVWLKDVAAGEIVARTWHEHAMRSVRTNFTASVLTYKVVSAALQVTGYVQTSVVLGKRHTAVGLGRFLRSPLSAARYVGEASAFMTQRAQSTVEAVQALNNARQGPLAAGKNAMIRYGYFMIGQVQRTVDIGTWLGAESKGLELFDGDIAKARSYADDVVARAQGSGEFIDKTALQRGTLGDNVRQSEFIRTMTALQGYMIAKGNVAYARTATTNFRSASQALKWAGDMVLLFAIEGMITAAIRGKLPDDEEGDGLLDDLSMTALKEGLSNLFGSIPGLAGLVTEMRGYDAKGVLANFYHAIAQATEQADQGEMDKAATKAMVTLAGYGAGVPASQINNTIDAIQAEREGQEVTPLEYATGPKKQ